MMFINKLFGNYFENDATFWFYNISILLILRKIVSKELSTFINITRKSL